MSVDVTPAAAAAPRVARITAHTRLELSMLMRNGEQLLLTVILPLALLVVMARTSVIDLGTGSEQERVDVVVPSVFALAILSTSFTAMAIQTGFERRYGVLRRIATTPLSRVDVLCGKALSIAVVEAAQLTLLGAVGLALGWQPDPLGLLLAVPVAMLGSAALATLGLLLAGVVRAEATLALANLMYLVLAGAGVLVPVDRLPESVQGVVELLPSAALAELLRETTLTADVDVVLVLVLAIWCVVGGWGVARFFRWE